MKERISFAQEAKEEIGKKDRTLSEERAFLSALARENGAFRLSKDAPSIDIDSELAVTAKATYRAIRRLYGAKCRFAYTRSTSLSSKTLYHVLLDEKTEEILEDLEVDYFSSRLPDEVIKGKNEVSAYLAGSFLAGGSVNDPSKPYYHLELTSDSEEYAKFLMNLLNKKTGYAFESKVIRRRNQYIVYLKKADQVSNFLILVGATNACLKFENYRVDRDFANYDNRLNNMDAANLRKSMVSGARQVSLIEAIDKKYGLAYLQNEKLITLCHLRLAHPEASLSELAEELSTELGTKISRSNVNHMFRNLEEKFSDEF